MYGEYTYYLPQSLLHRTDRELEYKITAKYSVNLDYDQ